MQNARSFRSMISPAGNNMMTTDQFRDLYGENTTFEGFSESELGKRGYYMQETPVYENNDYLHLS
jgi:hypothetical protein